MRWSWERLATGLASTAQRNADIMAMFDGLLAGLENDSVKELIEPRVRAMQGEVAKQQAELERLAGGARYCASSELAAPAPVSACAIADRDSPPVQAPVAAMPAALLVADDATTGNPAAKDAAVGAVDGGPTMSPHVVRSRPPPPPKAPQRPPAAQPSRLPERRTPPPMVPPPPPLTVAATPDDCYFYDAKGYLRCLLCRNRGVAAYADENHLTSARHCQRAQWPEAYLWTDN